MLGEGYARFSGVFRDGRVVLADGVQFPDGTEVEVVIRPLEFTPEEQAEFDAWDRLGDEAWAMLDEWEKEPTFTCPCCGYAELSSPAYASLPTTPWGDLGKPPYETTFGLPSYEVCSCCGFEFGDDDNPGTSPGVSFAQHLRDWIASGCQWFDPRFRPGQWSLDAQRTAAGIPNPVVCK